MSYLPNVENTLQNNNIKQIRYQDQGELFTKCLNLLYCTFVITLVCVYICSNILQFKHIETIETERYS